MKQSEFLLHVHASPRSHLSSSTAMGRILTRQIAHKFKQLDVVESDIGSSAPPAPDSRFAADNLLPLHERSHCPLSDKFINELATARAVVISTPMHNFGVPAALKAWIDHVVRPAQTFERSPKGKKGLLADRPVFVIVTCGGPVTGPHGQQDFLTPYLEYVLRVIGLSDIRTIRMDSMLRNPEHTVTQIETCKAWIAEQVAGLTIDT